MSDQTAATFDFDDWAGLYAENPAEFEARRQAALMIELARGTPEQCAAGKALLERYEQAVKGRPVEERAHIASALMLDSARKLQAQLVSLRESLPD